MHEHVSVWVPVLDRVTETSQGMGTGILQGLESRWRVVASSKAISSKAMASSLLFLNFLTP